MASDRNLDSELDSFRRQWLSDLRSRTDHAGAYSSNAGPSTRSVAGLFPSAAMSRRLAPEEDHLESVYLHGPSFDDLPAYHMPGQDSSSHPHPALAAGSSKNKELVSALDHFEEAMLKEAQGNMGDSLKLYRQAYKVSFLLSYPHAPTDWFQLDNGVDTRYREKHFPKAIPKPAAPSATATHPSSHSKQAETQPPAAPSDQPQPPQSIADLLASFSHLAIEPAAPAVEGSPPPPCPVASLPDELLVHILVDAVASHDVADFTRISLVCRRFAYLAAAEQRIWRQVCLTSPFGFPGMLYGWAVTVEGDPLDDEEDVAILEDGTVLSAHELQAQRQTEKLHLARALTPDVYATWKAMFRHRPRIRFNGLYISTVNYHRTGQASTNQATWGIGPILIVTYYRYLRFFRDGTAISLLTTAEPADVVHHVTKDMLELHRDSDRHASALPSAVMNNALKGRWRLSSAADYPDADPREQESDLFVETEGVGSKYIYRMDLSLRSAGKGAKNNKLIWRGFHSYNKLTDDLAEFGLKNDKPFFFSRVKSYGFGE